MEIKFTFAQGAVVEHPVSDDFLARLSQLKLNPAQALEAQLDSLSLSEQMQVIALPSLPASDLPAVIAFIEFDTTDSLDSCVDKFYTFTAFNRFRTQMESCLNKELIKERLETLHQKVCGKFPLLVLVDLGGTIFYRSSDKDLRNNGVYKRQQYAYFYRPGHRQFLKRVFSHPRVKLAFYSSIMSKNIQPVLYNLLGGGLADNEMQPILDGSHIFDQDFCPKMYDHPYYKSLADDTYDRYRNLHLVWQHDSMLGKYGQANTLLIDSDDKKV